MASISESRLNRIIKRGKETPYAENHGVVAVKRRLHIEAAEPGNLENSLDHKRAAQQPAKAGPKKGHHWNQAAAQRVLKNNHGSAALWRGRCEYSPATALRAYRRGEVGLYKRRSRYPE